MKAIDTNLVVRLLLDDDPAQSAAVRRLMAGGVVLVSPTVLLEAMWVLESRYGASAQELFTTVELLARHPSIVLGQPEHCAEFFRLWRAGLDPQDAAHVAFVGDVDAFVTFDKTFSKRAKKAGSSVAVELVR